MEFRKHVLANGLEIVAECNAEAHSTALGFFVQTGARDEADDVSGVSHFLEHMVFKGTPTRTADDVNREFDEMGAHYNAFTSEEHTVYYAAVLPEYQTAAVELLGDIMRPSLREEDFDTEKQVIIEEIRMYEDQPPFGADEKCKAAHFGPHPLGRSVLGTIESITDLPVERDAASTSSAATRPAISRWSARARSTSTQLVEHGRQAVRRLAADRSRARTSRRPRRISGFRVPAKRARPRSNTCCNWPPGPAATDADRYAAKILATILGDDSGSRLYWELVDPGLAEQASLGHHDYQGAGMFMTYMSCEPEHAQDNLQRIAEIYRPGREAGVTRSRAGASQEQDQLARRARQRAAARPAVHGRRQLDAAARISHREARPGSDRRRHARRRSPKCLARYPLSINTTLAIGPATDLKPSR